MKTRILLLSVLLVSLIAGMVAADQFPVTVVDDRGKEIRIQEEPERIVVAGLPLYSEILFDIGAGDKIVGVAQSPNNPPQVKDIPKVGTTFEPNIEEIINLEPDLVFGAWGQIRDRLEKKGITVLTAGSAGGWITGLNDLFEAIKTTGKAVGKLNKATRLLGEMATEIVQIESKVLAKNRPKAAFLYVSSAGAYASGGGSMANELILRAGGENVFSDLSGVPKVSYEEIIDRNPQFIFTDPAYLANIKENKFLKSLEAVKKDRVYGIKASNLTSTRVTKALRKMAQALHPDAFSKSK